jgi:hypothetical protein
MRRGHGARLRELLRELLRASLRARVRASSPATRPTIQRKISPFGSDDPARRRRERRHPPQRPRAVASQPTHRVVHMLLARPRVTPHSSIAPAIVCSSSVRDCSPTSSADIAASRCRTCTPAFVRLRVNRLAWCAARSRPRRERSPGPSRHSGIARAPACDRSVCGAPLVNHAAATRATNARAIVCARVTSERRRLAADGSNVARIVRNITVRAQSYTAEGIIGMADIRWRRGRAGFADGARVRDPPRECEDA